MVQFFPDATLLPSLHRLIGANLHYFIFANDITPGFGDELSDYTVTSDSPTQQTVAAAAFTLDSVSGHIARVTAADVTFTWLHNQTVYGYFVCTALAGADPAGDLVLAARFDTAPIAMVIGGTMNITPTLAIKMSA